MSKSADKLAYDILNKLKAGNEKYIWLAETLKAFRDAAVKEALLDEQNHSCCWKRLVENQLVSMKKVENIQEGLISANSKLDHEIQNEAYEKAAKVADEYFRAAAIAKGQPDIGKIKTYLGSKIRALKYTAPAKELLFSGQCVHHIPIGQPCSACGR